MSCPPAPGTAGPAPSPLTSSQGAAAPTHPHAPGVPWPGCLVPSCASSCLPSPGRHREGGTWPGGPRPRSCRCPEGQSRFGNAAQSRRTGLTPGWKGTCEGIFTINDKIHYRVITPKGHGYLNRSQNCSKTPSPEQLPGWHPLTDCILPSEAQDTPWHPESQAETAET